MGVAPSILCFAEDRVSEEPALRVALQSALERTGCHILLFAPHATQRLKDWLPRTERLVFHDRTPGSATGWNVKPYALLEALQQGCREAWWVDSDVVLLGDPSTVYAAIPPRHFVVTEEASFAAYEDQGARARAWGFSVARDFGHTLNSCVLRVAQDHRELLEHWIALLETPAYTAAQTLEWNERPFHLLGDQDALTALLCSDREAHLPVHVLRRGQDIVQYYGPTAYSVRERLHGLLSSDPTFIHAQGHKPWRKKETSASKPLLNRYFDSLLADTSPHSLEALKLAEDGNAERDWARAQTFPGKVLRALGGRSLFLTGLPLAVIADAAMLVKKLVRKP